MNYESLRQELQHSLDVMAEAERLNAEMRSRRARSLQQADKYREELEGYRERIDRNLAEITEKLNRLIRAADGQSPAHPT